MKKFISLVLMCMLCAVTFAGNPIKNLTGKDQLKAMLKNGGTATVEIDWSAAKFDKTKDLKTTLAGDYDFIVADCVEEFVNGFNEKSKKIKMAANDANAQYKYVIKVANLDSYYCVMGWFPSWEGKVWGSCQIIDTKNNKALVSFDIVEAEDGKDQNKRECYGETFGELGETIAKLK